MIRFNCPNCGETLVIRNENREFAFCEYCGQRILLEKYRIMAVNGEVPTETENTDPIVKWSEEKRYEVSRLKNDASRREFIKVWAVFFGAAVLLSFIFSLAAGLETGLIVLLYVGGIVAAVGAVILFCLMPESENRKALTQGKKVRFPKYPDNIAGKNYKAVRNELYNAGFTNITCINLHDVKLGIKVKPDLIESVTADGREVFVGGKIYSPEIKIVIRYHGR